MAAQPQLQAELIDSERQRWRFFSRVAFRFWFLYLGLYCLTTQIIFGVIPILGGYLNLGNTAPFRQTVSWTAVHVFHVSTPLVYFSYSGDKTYDWVSAFCILIFAVFATAVWSIVDRKRGSYSALHKWFHLFLRFALAAQMVNYGMIKVFPLQMPYPYLAKLLEPFGNFSPMGVLWSSIGVSPTYEIFTGSAEMLGGILLIFPRTATFGALVCLADLTEIFMLNMTYDVPVKLLSFHLIVISLVLLAAELPRIVRFFFSNRIVGPSAHPKLFGTPRANRAALVLQVLLGLLLLANHGYEAWTTWHIYVGGALKSPLYGIWNIDRLSIDGELRPALITDTGRWRRVIFEGPEITFQRPDDTFVGYSTIMNTVNRNITLRKNTDRTYLADFKYHRASPDQLTLDGDMDGHKLHLELARLDLNKLPLVNRGFHWVQEYPFNR